MSNQQYPTDVKATQRDQQYIFLIKLHWNKTVNLANTKTSENQSMKAIIPSEKGMTRSLSTTLPDSSRKRSGRNCCGCCQSSGSMCALYRFTITCISNYQCTDYIYSVRRKKDPLKQISLFSV